MTVGQLTGFQGCPAGHGLMHARQRDNTVDWDLRDVPVDGINAAHRARISGRYIGAAESDADDEAIEFETRRLTAKLLAAVMTFRESAVRARHQLERIHV